MEPFATFNTVANLGVTAAPLDPQWGNARAVDGGLIDFVRTLQAKLLLDYRIVH